MRLADCALDASMHKRGAAGGDGGYVHNASEEARVDAFRKLLARVAQQVKPSARNLAATEANGGAARLLARYVRPRTAEREAPDDDGLLG